MAGQEVINATSFIKLTNFTFLPHCERSRSNVPWQSFFTVSLTFFCSSSSGVLKSYFFRLGPVLVGTLLGAVLFGVRESICRFLKALKMFFRSAQTKSVSWMLSSRLGNLTFTLKASYYYRTQTRQVYWKIHELAMVVTLHRDPKWMRYFVSIWQPFRYPISSGFFRSSSYSFWNYSARFLTYSWHINVLSWSSVWEIRNNKMATRLTELLDDSTTPSLALPRLSTHVRSRPFQLLTSGHECSACRRYVKFYHR